MKMWKKSFFFKKRKKKFFFNNNTTNFIDINLLNYARSFILTEQKGNASLFNLSITLHWHTNHRNSDFSFNFPILESHCCWMTTTIRRVNVSLENSNNNSTCKADKFIIMIDMYVQCEWKQRTMWHLLLVSAHKFLCIFLMIGSTQKTIQTRTYRRFTPKRERIHLPRYSKHETDHEIMNMFFPYDIKAGNSRTLYASRKWGFHVFFVFF